MMTPAKTPSKKPKGLLYMTRGDMARAVLVLAALGAPSVPIHAARIASRHNLRFTEMDMTALAGRLRAELAKFITDGLAALNAQPAIAAGLQGETTVFLRELGSHTTNAIHARMKGAQ